MAQVAAALAKLNHGDTPFLLPKNQNLEHTKSDPKTFNHETLNHGTLEPKNSRFKTQEFKKKNLKTREKTKNQPIKSNIIPLEKGMERYRIEVGHCHGVRPRNIVGAIANEAGLESKYIGNIDINQDFSFIDLPYGMPKQVFKLLERTRVSSRQMAISKCA